MGKQPSSLTEQVTVILSPDPQAREIGADLLRKAALDMGLRSEFEDFISDVPSLFMVFNPVTENRPFAQTIADAMPVAVENLPILSDDILEVNDEAWVIYHGDVYPCDVEDMPDCPYKDINTITIRIADGIGLHEVNRTDVFLRKADAGAALRFREYKAMHAYLQEIKTLDDLHRFPLTHVLTGSEPDYAARMAYEIKRAELNP